MKIKFSHATVLDYSDLTYYDGYIKNLSTNWWLKDDEVVYNEYISKVYYIDEYGDVCYDTYNWNSHSWGELSIEEPKKESIVASIRPALVLDEPLSKFRVYENFLRFNGGKYIINNKSYTLLIFEHGLYLVANFTIGDYTYFNYDHKFEKDGPYYDLYKVSYIKTVVDSWFNSNFSDEVEVELASEVRKNKKEINSIINILDEYEWFNDLFDKDNKDKIYTNDIYNKNIEFYSEIRREFKIDLGNRGMNSFEQVKLIDHYLDKAIDIDTKFSKYFKIDGMNKCKDIDDLDIIVNFKVKIKVKDENELITIAKQIEDEYLNYVNEIFDKFEHVLNKYLEEFEEWDDENGYDCGDNYSTYDWSYNIIENSEIKIN